ncbi:hypothetical protein [Chelatococcus asaccharovorans]|uniref:Uncharacterized protein n=1 Tax=Chelatococcus asaccharovorans TaxID=28210 RepID=A0A2V3UAY7_9HYPH|nr:hypothetical protein [Chelatococcus asaccharovorans]MBS7703265.1 hypothetical protein [Chelatococcus asaccharovorans]PXW61597.1 hypothetical protein C7450_103114 [Chelatococcus asaccharovorans]
MNTDDINWNALQHVYCRDALRRYIEHGIQPGGFLTAVLSNDLREACARADAMNRHLLFDYVQFLYNEAPGGCWGSPEVVDAWISHGGLTGLQRHLEAV